MKPDSSRKTSVAPRRAAFFLDGGTRPSARSRSRLPSARAPWSPASVPSTRVDERGSSERGRRGTRLRRSARSEPSLWDTSIGRSASRVLLRLSKEARRARSLVQQKECVGAPGGASAPSPSYLSCPNPSPTGSPTPDCNPPFSSLRFVNGPPSPELLLDVCAFPAPLHFLPVSWRGSVAQATLYSIEKPGSIGLLTCDIQTKRALIFSLCMCQCRVLPYSPSTFVANRRSAAAIVNKGAMSYWDVGIRPPLWTTPLDEPPFVRSRPVCGQVGPLASL